MKKKIAVISMACVFPGALNPKELWQNVLAGRRYFRKSPKEKLPMDYISQDKSAPDMCYADQMAVIENWTFDPVSFRIPPVTANATDIAHWLALSTTKQALDHSGLNLDEIDRTRIGTILGNTLGGESSRTHNLRLRYPYAKRALIKSFELLGIQESLQENLLSTYEHYYKTPIPEATEDTLAGYMSNTITGRITNYFDLGGGGFTIDGACSSSLLAISHSCNALVHHELDMMISGGVDVCLDPFELVGFSKAHALAENDIRPYDRQAEGMLPGEGCGIFILMREEDAIAKGLPIQALLTGWGYSTDGAGGITAPTVDGQVRVLQRAYDKAGYSISSVGLIEGHGTGTVLGDKVEIQALTQALKNSPPVNETTWLGSIKGNIGHCKAAAGSAGLVKTIMALKNKIIPPTGNCQHPCDSFNQPYDKLRPSTRGTSWAKPDHHPRRAGVSAMGFGGSNAHVTLEEANTTGPTTNDDLDLLDSSQSYEVIFLSAEKKWDLLKITQKLISTAERICRAELTDLSAALCKVPDTGSWRAAIVTESPWQLVIQLKRVVQWLSENSESRWQQIEDKIFVGHAKTNATCIALYPGQASQRINMNEYAFRHFPQVRELVQRVDFSLRDIVKDGLISSILVNPHAADNSVFNQAIENLQQTNMAQPGIVLSSVSNLAILRQMGIEPDFHIGHSVGEISALHAAGAFTDVEAVRLAAVRGSEMMRASEGGMAAVMANATVTQKLLQDNNIDLAIANYNSDNQTVVSGNLVEIEKLQQTQTIGSLAGATVVHRLNVSKAFHSPSMAEIKPAFGEYLENITVSEINDSVISTVTGEQLKQDVDIKKLLTQQITSTVRFTDAVQQALTKKPDLWIEIGPSQVLSNLVKDIIPENTLCLPTDIKNEESSASLGKIFACAYVIGVSISKKSLFEHRFHRDFNIDNYSPKFIVNPAEMPVIDPEVTPVLTSSGLIDMQPDKVDPADFQYYLTTRAPYLRNFVEFDYHQFSQQPSKIITPKSQKESGTIDKSQDDTVENPSQDLSTYVIDWIANRTGFSASDVKPEMKLRDDLGLDSIKLGELSIAMSQISDQKLAIDPLGLSNATVSEFIDTYKIGSIKQSSNRESEFDYVEPFQMSFDEYPMVNEKSGSSLRNKNCLLIPMNNSIDVTEIEKGLLQSGAIVECILPNAYILQPLSADAMVIIMPSVNSQRLDLQLDQTLKLIDILKCLINKVPELLVISTASPKEEPELQRAGAGIIKSFKLEINVFAKWINLDSSSHYLITEIIQNELETAGRYVSYDYRNGRRFIEHAKQIIDNSNQQLPLNDTDVVFITGGAKGITAEMALELAKESHAKFALIGSSAHTDSQVKATLQRFDELNIKCHYYSCDITCSDNVSSTVAFVEKELGPITAILHGAGISHLQSFGNLSQNDFRQCFNVKCQGLDNLKRLIDFNNLKLLHVISSIIGKIGMQGQADYSYSNAWLDEAVRNIQQKYPRIQCLSIGYSVWADTGIGKKLGVVDTLRKGGIAPLSTKDALKAYKKIWVTKLNPVHIITGKLPADVLQRLFRSAPKLKGHFLRNIAHWVPGVELVSVHEFSVQSDPYILEHVYDGTPILPGVIAIEAMIQCAMACLDREEKPVMKNINFIRPLIFSGNSRVLVKIVARKASNSTSIKVSFLSSDIEHFSALCDFDDQEFLSGLNQLSEKHVMNELSIDPEHFHPSPLFQGKLFRRIQCFYTIGGSDNTVISKIDVPMENPDIDIMSNSMNVTLPIVRDAFLQTAAVALPQGYLPISIEKVKFISPLPRGKSVYCRSVILEQDSKRASVDITLFSESFQILEVMMGVQLIRADVSAGRSYFDPVDIVEAIHRANTDMYNDKVSVDYVNAENDVNIAQWLSEDEITEHTTRASEQRLPATINNSIAIKKSLISRLPFNKINAQDIFVSRHDSGKPHVISIDVNFKANFSDFDVSVSDANGLSIAIVGNNRAGIDIEFIHTKDEILWQGLLGRSAYQFANKLTTEYTGEDFDCSATRVWALKETLSKMMLNFDDLELTLESSTTNGWYWFKAQNANHDIVKLGSTIAKFDNKKLVINVGYVTKYRKLDISPFIDNGLTRKNQLSNCLDNLNDRLENCKKRIKTSTSEKDIEVLYHDFVNTFKSCLNKLTKLGKNLDKESLLSMKLRSCKIMEKYAKHSDAFGRALIKPFGYPGDHVLLDRMFRNQVNTTGLAGFFDRMFLSRQGSEAVRQRSYWVIRELHHHVTKNSMSRLTILDLGSGPMTIERVFSYHYSGSLTIKALDFDAQSFDYAKPNFDHDRVSFQTKQLNLVSPSGVAKIRATASNTDVCICMGLIEYLEDDAAEAILSALRMGADSGTYIYTSNYLPNQDLINIMEWYLDWSLVYRSEKDMERLAKNSGFSDIQLSYDATHSIVLMKLRVD